MISFHELATEARDSITAGRRSKSGSRPDLGVCLGSLDSQCALPGGAELRDLPSPPSPSPTPDYGTISIHEGHLHWFQMCIVRKVGIDR